MVVVSVAGPSQPWPICFSLASSSSTTSWPGAWPPCCALRGCSCSTTHPCPGKPGMPTLWLPWASLGCALLQEVRGADPDWAPCTSGHGPGPCGSVPEVQGTPNNSSHPQRVSLPLPVTLVWVAACAHSVHAQLQGRPLHRRTCAKIQARAPDIDRAFSRPLLPLYSSNRLPLDEQAGVTSRNEFRMM